MANFIIVLVKNARTKTDIIGGYDNNEYEKTSMKYIFKIFSLFFAVMMQAQVTNAENYNDRFIGEDAPVIAFTNARVIDGTGAKAKEKQTVIIRDGRITKIGRSGKVGIPKGAKKINLKGKSLLPGWVMTHEHLYYGTHPGNLPANIMDFFLTQQSISYPRLYLAAGVTSARTAGGIQPYTELGIKRAIDSGDLVGPDFDLTAPHLSGLGALLQLQAVNSVEDARATVRYWAGQGFTSFKGLGPIKDEYLAGAIDEAHKLGLRFTADIGGSIKRHRHAIDSGIDHLEHVIASTDVEGKLMSDQQVEQMMQYYIDHDVAVTSTLGIFDNKIKSKEILEFLTDYSRKEYERSPFGILGEYVSNGKLLKRQQTLQLEFWQKGGKLTVGTDPAVPGLIAGSGSLRAIELLVEAGIPSLEVIKIATLNGAEVIGISKDRGTIEVGKRAHLIVINGDPSARIKDIYNIETVFKKGVGYSPFALKESVKGTVGGPG